MEELEDIARPGDLKPRMAGFMRAPWLAYQAMREEAGPLWTEPETGVVFVLDYALAEEVMRSHTRFSSFADRAAMREGGLPAEVLEIKAQGWPLALTMVQNDGPSHEDYRKLVGPFFLPRRLRVMEPFVAARIGELLDAIDAKGGRTDFFPDFAVPLPVSVIGEYLGMRHLGDDTVKRWSDAFADEIGFLTSDERAVEIARLTLECHKAMVALCDERRGGEGTDIITALANATKPDGEPLDNSELLSILTQLMVAGNETTTSTLGFALLRLARDPDLFARLKGEPEKIAPFLEEVLRLDSPIQGQFRKAVGDQQLDGHMIPDGTMLHVRFAAANRDRQVWGEGAGEVQLDRKPPKPHMAFGNGIHFCVGAALSRLEMRLALAEILARYRSVRLAEPEQDLPFRTNFHQRGMTSLPLEFEP
ncbi:MAG: cytochrome P450 [Erythrobacter sp.]|uniref:cytochrome P450 n=1 Tax=Erythrobacter sp. TaxID=1042 RepID=UPI0032ED6A83